MTELPDQYLVYNRDHHGNRKVVMLDDGGGGRKLCWNLTEEQADLVIKRLYAPQTKSHGQMHDKLGYPAGKLAEFLDAEDLLY